jgi:hypothetical protein
MKFQKISHYMGICYGLVILGRLSAAPDVWSVLYFNNTTQEKKHAWLSKGLADMLITDLSQVPQIKVVEREELQKVLKEQWGSCSAPGNWSWAVIS